MVDRSTPAQGRHQRAVRFGAARTVVLIDALAVDVRTLLVVGQVELESCVADPPFEPGARIGKAGSMRPTAKA